MNTWAPLYQSFPFFREKLEFPIFILKMLKVLTVVTISKRLCISLNQIEQVYRLDLVSRLPFGLWAG